MSKRRAILSVSDKTGLNEFAKGLVSLGFELLSTGGTAKALRDAGIAVRSVSEVTNFPEILGGRVKTLHPNLLAGVLARVDRAEDRQDLEKQGIAPVELICVNLYPFAQTIAKGAVPLAEAIEQVDIGGPTMIRAAAKNYPHVLVVTSPADYAGVLEALKGDKVTEALRFDLARKAFTHTAAYDATISEYLTSFESLAAAKQGQDKAIFPHQLHLHFTKAQDLRYGENPHQKAAYYEPQHAQRAWEQLHGKELSFNNLLDMQAAQTVVQEFESPAAVIIKHTNPCGAAIDRKDLLTAYRKALASDEVSAFGGIVALNGTVTRALADELAKTFLEVIAAPTFDDDALEILKAKKNLRLLKLHARLEPQGFDVKRLAQGLLVQQWDRGTVDLHQAKVATKRQPTEAELTDLDFAWRLARHVKSNAIVLVKNGQSIGVGAGQMSRVDSTQVALQKAQNAKHAVSGCVLASDAFFPFRDSIDVIAKAGIRAIVQPGGSVRDAEVIEAANEHDIAMIFTEMRHFKH